MKRRLIIGLGTLLLVAATLPAGEVAKAPALDIGIWKYTHGILWHQDDGPVWVSAGHGPALLLIIPHGVKEERGGWVTTLDGSGLIVAVTVEIRKVAAFDTAKGIPVATEKVGDIRLTADKPVERSDRNAGMRLREGYTDLWIIGKFPEGAYFSTGRKYARVSSQFSVNAYHYAYGGLRELPDAARQVAGARQAFENLQLVFAIAELIEMPTLPMQETWKAGAEMPRGDYPRTDWYEHETVRVPWALTGNPPAHVRAILRVDTEAAFTFLPDPAPFNWPVPLKFKRLTAPDADAFDERRKMEELRLDEDDN